MTERLPVVNATETGLRLPDLGTVEVCGNTAIAIRSGDTVIGLPGSHAIDFALDLIEVVLDKTGSIDRAVLERLITRAIEIRCRLMALHTHDAAAVEAEMRRVLQ